MELMSLIVIAAGAALGWYKVSGSSRRHPLNWRWFALALAAALGLSFLPGATKQTLSFDWLLAVGCGAYARAARVAGRGDLWRTAEPDGPPDEHERRSERATVAADDPRRAARRAVIRWAWRLFRREWRQHLIVLSLLTLAVAGTVIGAGAATNAAPPAAAGFGSAGHLVQLSGDDPRLTEKIDALRRRFSTVDVIENQTVATGLSQGADLRAQDPDGPYGGPMLKLLTGRYPSSAGQVAVTGSLAASLNLKPGGTWNQAGRVLNVVGLVEDPQNLADEFALVAPGQLAAADSVTVLFDASAAQLAHAPLPDGMTAQAPGSAGAAFGPTVIVLAVAVLALTFIGLVAAAGFAVLARRRQRALGMLAALGATERDVQWVITADGVIVGTVGAVVGVLLGLAGWIAYAPRFSVSAGHLVPWTALPWALVVCEMVLAVACATLAAWRPAHAVARMPIVAALSDRPVPARAPRRSALPALILLITAPVLLATSGGWGGDGGGRDTLFQLGGLLLSALGLALSAPFAMAALAGPGRHVPAAARLALRDLSRYRSRSAAALAAGSLAVLIAMLVTLITTGRYSDPVDYYGPNLASNQLVVYAPGDGPGTGRGPNGGYPREKQATYQQRADAIASSLGGGSGNVLALDPVEADVMHKTGQETRGDSGSVYLATPAVLAHYGIDPKMISPTTLLITSRPGLAGLSGLFLLYGDLANPNGQTNVAPDPSVQTLAALPTETSEPNLLVTEYAVQHLKLTVDPTSGWLIQTPRPPTAVQINTVRQLALAAGMTVETRSEAPTLAQVSNDATAAGMVIALGVLAMMTGLIRAESANDVRILTATGASARTRRNITATTAGTLALLAAIGGTVVGYVDTVAFFGTEFLERLSQVPTADLVAVLVGLPAAATLGGWLFAGREATGLAGPRPE